MSATVHLPISEFESALDHARSGDDVFLDGDNEMFEIRLVPAGCGEYAPTSTRLDMRPLSEILADPTVEWSDLTLDDNWSRDLEAVRAEGRREERNPWAE